MRENKSMNKGVFYLGSKYGKNPKLEIETLSQCKLQMYLG